MPPAATPRRRRKQAPDLCVIPSGVYRLGDVLQIAGISRTTLWRCESQEGLPLKRFKAGARPYVRGSDFIAWLEERARRQSEREAAEAAAK